MLFWILSAAVTLPYAGLLAWYRRWWMQLAAVKAPVAAPKMRLTVLVPMRNEAACVGTCIQSLAAQDYPTELLEILLIDDHSQDETAAIAALWLSRYPHIHCMPLPADAGVGKKAAIEYGVRQAAGEWIVCTDADCVHEPNWLRTLAAAMQKDDLAFIAAPVVYHTKPRLLSVFQTLDFAMMQGITGASVAAKAHAMCNGANLAYTKKAFLEVEGFKGIDRLPTGDDMLLMYKIWQKYPNGVKWLRAEDAIAATDPCADWRSFFNQRIRWASKAAYYDDRRIFWVLLGVYLFNFSFFAWAVGAFWCAVLWWVLLAQLAVKCMAELYLLIPVARFFGKQGWLVWFPFLQGHHIVYTLIAGWLGRFGQYEWKGRVVFRPGFKPNDNKI